MSRISVAMVGCGSRARRAHLMNLATFDDVELVAVCDPIAAARDEAADEFGIERRYAAVDDLLENEALDAAFVATPPHLNAGAALKCLERGVATLVEKPPGMSVAETVALRRAAQRTGATAMVAWNHRFHPIVTQARAMVEARGPVVQLVGEFHKSMSRLQADGHLPEIVLDRFLFETPIHSIDLVRDMAGSRVAEVHSVVRRAFSPYNDVFGALVVFESGCVAHLIFNNTTDARFHRYEIHGRDISAYLEGVTQGYVVSDGRRHELTGAGTGGAREQARYFVDCVREDRPVSLPAANLDEAVKTMELAEAVLAGRRE